jgi:CRISPR-associated protein, Cas02710 family
MNDCLLILTVGTGTAGIHSNLAQGLINTLSKVQPRLFWLVPSAHPDSTGIADLVRESVPAGSCFRPWNASTLYCSIGEPDDLFVCRSALRQVIGCARKFLGKGERLLVNPTSGTKQMSVAATLAALDEEIGEIIFTVGERHEGVVRTGTERVVSFSTEQFFLERTLSEAERLFQAGAYHGAALLLEQYGQVARDAHDLAACLREWQRLNYKEARQIAAGSSAPTLVKLRHHLTQLAQSPEESLLVLADLISSADDLLHWGGHEEALARYYRAAELAAKLRLTEKHHLSKPYQLADLRDAAPSMQGSFEANARDGVCYLGLRRAMQILQALDDRFAHDYFADEKLGELLELRNKTVVGHGALAVSLDSVKALRSHLGSFLGRHFPKLDQAFHTALRPRSLLGNRELRQDSTHASPPDQKT